MLYTTLCVDFKALTTEVSPPVCVTNCVKCMAWHGLTKATHCLYQIRIELWDYDRISANQLIGTARISLSSAFKLPQDQMNDAAAFPAPSWFQLTRDEIVKRHQKSVPTVGRRCRGGWHIAGDSPCHGMVP